MADIKISELEPTTDLEGLYTIGSDKNNLSKKVSLQFLKDAANYANEQGDYAKQAGDTVNGNVGVSDYPEFSASKSYVIGDIVRYNGVLYAFTANHAASAWNGNDVKATSINAITSGKLTELESEIGKTSHLIDTFERKAGGIGNKTWQDVGFHIAIPINAGDVIKIKKGSADVLVFALLSAYSYENKSIVFATGYNDRIIVRDNETKNIIAPADATYLIINDDNPPRIFYPSFLSINGIVYATTINNEISQLSANIEDITNGLSSKIQSFQRLHGGVAQNGIWQDIDFHIAIPINAGDVIEIRKSKNKKIVVFALLNEYSPSEKKLNVCDGLSRVVLTDNQRYQVVAPSDATYLIINDESIKGSLYPASLRINGKQFADNLISDMDIIVMGDSIVAPAERSGLIPSRQYMTLAFNQLGGTFENYGVGGNVWSTWDNAELSVDKTTFANGGINETNCMMASFYLLLGRIRRGERTAPNYIICSCGTNDLSKTIHEGLGRTEEESLGNAEDVYINRVNLDNPANAYPSLVASMTYFVECCKVYMPNTRLIFIAPIQRGDSEGSLTRVQKTADAMEKCAAFLSIPLLRMDDKCGIYRWTCVRDHLLATDGVHPLEKGAEQMAEVVVPFLKKYLV